MVERVHVARSRSRGIIFDGGDNGKNSVGSIVRDCLLEGRPPEPGVRLTSGGTLNTPSGVMLLAGTPTAAGTYPLTLIAYQGNNRTLIASPAFTYNIVITEGTLALPTFTTQPANQTVNAGSTATFTVAATSSGGVLHYQWTFNGSNVGSDSSGRSRLAVGVQDADLLGYDDEQLDALEADGVLSSRVPT